MRSSEEDHKTLEFIDYMLPIVAYEDVDLRTLTGCMKMARSFVESRVAIIHTDDLAMGPKKFSNREVWTIVPTSKYIQRSKAARMSCDVMGYVTSRKCDSRGIWSINA
ncbi:hypothetical protein F5Y19DRAFT_448944 [Xylariaceae sp. FL1651]|nr:hypothetical protein F5Y19DRAFT_448944 [Xylariaceae sp. FL1651]